MTRIITIISLCFVFASSTLAAGKYENNHFSINALVSDGTAENSQPLIMSLPASAGFAPNINVQIQQYPNTLKEYAELSIKQFEQFEFKILQNKLTTNSLVLEYSGAMQDRKLHWYAMAYKKGSTVFLVTATSTESQWKNNSKALIASVRSFKLK